MTDYSSVTTQKDCVITILCPGLTEKEISIMANSEDNQLSIEGKPAEGNDRDDVDLDIKCNIMVDKAYDVSSTEKAVSNGILTLTIKTAEHIKSI